MEIKPLVDRGARVAQNRRPPRRRPRRRLRHPVPTAVPRPADTKVVIIVGRDPQRDRELSRRCRPRLHRGEQVHVQRGQGLQPERDLGQGQGGGRRRIGGHLHGPRQRLAEPVHLRPQLHDQGRLRAQRDPGDGDYNNKYYGEPYGRDARPRAGRDRPPPPPLLCVGQLRAGQPRADAQRRSSACRQLRGRLLQGRCIRGHRRRALRRGALPPGAVHDPPDDRPDVAKPVQCERQIASFSSTRTPARPSARTR